MKPYNLGTCDFDETYIVRGMALWLRSKLSNHVVSGSISLYGTLSICFLLYIAQGKTTLWVDLANGNWKKPNVYYMHVCVIYLSWHSWGCCKLTSFICNIVCEKLSGCREILPCLETGKVSEQEGHTAVEKSTSTNSVWPMKTWKSKG